MNMKKILISALVSLMATGAIAQTSGNVIHEMNVDTEAYSYSGKSFYTADLDSIVFYRGGWSYGNPGEVYNMMSIRGKGMVKRSADFPISEIRGIEFTFRDSRKLHAPMFTGGEILESGKGNSVKVTWEPVNGAAGYELKYCTNDNTLFGSIEFWGNGDFERWLNGTSSENSGAVDLSADGGVLKLDAENAEATVEGLRYSDIYYFAVRALSKDGEEFNSDWSIRYCIGRYNNFTMSTMERYKVPNILSRISRDETSVRVGFNLSYAAHQAEDSNEDFAKNFEIVDGNFIADEIRVQGQNGVKVDEKWACYKLTAQDLENGYVDITGLEEASYYYITLANSRIASTPDARYNTIVVTTKGNSEPILIKHEADPLTEGYEACDITPIIKDFMADGRYASRVFYLEGGKAYYISEHLAVSKGITLETVPEDVAAGKRAAVYIGWYTRCSIHILSIRLLFYIGYAPFL